MKLQNSLDLFLSLNMASVTLILHTPFFTFIPEFIRIMLSVLFVFVLPGFTTAQALFAQSSTHAQTQERRLLNGTEWLMLVFGLSLAISALGALILHTLPWGLQKWSWLIFIYGVIFISCIITVIRRGGVWVQLPQWRSLLSYYNGGTPFKLGVLMISATMLVGALWMARSAEEYANRFEQDSFTQFWMLPAAKNLGSASLKIGVRSGEATPIEYRLVVNINDKPIFEKDGLMLKPGERWERTITFADSGSTLTATQGKSIAEARLYRITDPQNAPYRWVRVNIE